jgi:hypothetical protein
MTRSRLAFTLLPSLLLGCASSAASVSPVRFENRPPVTVVNDRLDTPEAPAENVFYPLLYYTDRLFIDLVDDALAVEVPRRALSVNSLDEVPDSTWYTNRDLEAMSPAEVGRGANVDESPELHTPWKIKSTKTTGAAVGFIVEDARGYTYVVKFDMKGYPEAETGADVIVARLLYALGYNVPQDYVVYLRPEDLVLTEKSEVKFDLGEDRPMTRADLQVRLDQIEHEPDGRIRALASKFITGTPLGGHPTEGTREGDPNDTVPHQHRRELRGLYPVFNWLQHTDVKANNTLDSWIEDPADPDHHYVLHYWIDFGKALGVMPYTSQRKDSGYKAVFSIRDILGKMLTLGLYPYEYEKSELPGIRGVGLFNVEHYDPTGFEPNVPYAPFEHADRFDKFWGAKLLMRLSPAQLRAAVEEARFSDPRATGYLTRVLVGRQRATGRYWFTRVNPLDRIELARPDTLCFTDLMLAYELEDVGATTTYQARTFDRRGQALGWKAAVRPDAAGRACVAGFAPASGDEGYTIVQLRTRRGEKALPPTEVHLARDPATGDLRIIGLERR